MKRIGLCILILCGTDPSSAQAAPKPGVARALSISSTLLPLGAGLLLLTTDDGVRSDNRFYVGMGFVTLGASVGPSVGQWYAGGGTDAWTTFALRTLSSGMMTGGAIGMARGDPSVETLGTALASIGGVLTGALLLYDVIDAGRTAKQARYRSGFALTRQQGLLRVARCGAFPCGSVVSIQSSAPRDDAGAVGSEGAWRAVGASWDGSRSWPGSRAATARASSASRTRLRLTWART